MNLKSMSSIVAGALVATSLGVAAAPAIAAVPPVFSRLPAETTEERYAPVAAALPDGNALNSGWRHLERESEDCRRVQRGYWQV